MSTFPGRRSSTWRSRLCVLLCFRLQPFISGQPGKKLAVEKVSRLPSPPLLFVSVTFFIAEAYAHARTHAHLRNRSVSRSITFTSLSLLFAFSFSSAEKNERVASATAVASEHGGLLLRCGFIIYRSVKCR